MRQKKFIVRVQRDLDYYLKEHQNKTNRILHYFAFMSAFMAWLFLFFDLKVTLILALLHYLLSWVGHFYFEGNKPASFRYPLIGFYSGFTWFFIKTFEIVTGKEILNKWIYEKLED
ncbi:DUF962 domain-containing protein [Paenibacillus sp. LMG 31458]|uniref:DUF962 domain-containing protein n=1 Tax=Paenibacillus phytorum TaxID=2654977 RepID=A0ABX1XWF5_9BACL|nr:DUF962 domain-containing protein [Paenibacillus phytorum]NOU72851.1 DUF962 domain-containing protein [Paenibacillus phytorum]